MHRRTAMVSWGVAGLAVFAIGIAVGAQVGGHRRITALPVVSGAPYSQAVMAGDLLFLSGNIGRDPATGKPPAAFADAARQALANQTALLEAAGLRWEHVVKVNVYVEDIATYDEFNKVYTGVIPEPRPARTFLAVRNLPNGGQVEIEAIAVRPR